MIGKSNCPITGVQLQPFTKISETFEEIVMVMINNVTKIPKCEQTSALLRKISHSHIIHSNMKLSNQRIGESRKPGMEPDKNSWWGCAKWFSKF